MVSEAHRQEDTQQDYHALAACYFTNTLQWTLHYVLQLPALSSNYSSKYINNVQLTVQSQCFIGAHGGISSLLLAPAYRIKSTKSHQRHPIYVLRLLQSQRLPDLHKGFEGFIRLFKDSVSAARHHVQTIHTPTEHSKCECKWEQVFGSIINTSLVIPN